MLLPGNADTRERITEERPHEELLLGLAHAHNMRDAQRPQPMELQHSQVSVHPCRAQACFGLAAAQGPRNSPGTISYHT